MEERGTMDDKLQSSDASQQHGGLVTYEWVTVSPAT